MSDQISELSFDETEMVNGGIIPAIIAGLMWGATAAGLVLAVEDALGYHDHY